jgi:hypothetical protein
MNIALLEIDNQKYPNLALMKIARHHRNQGDQIEWFDPLFSRPDILYASKVFSFTPDYDYFPPGCEIRKGGSGYSLKEKLPDEIEILDPDYSIYPDCNYSLQLFSRGCFRKCGFCIVPEKEGMIRPVKPMKLNPRGKCIEILDNNFFGNKEWPRAIELLKVWDQPVNFHGIDIRIMNDAMAESLAGLKFGGVLNSTWGDKKRRGQLVKKNLKIAWDDPQDDIKPRLNILTKYIKPYKITCYVLIGYNSTPSEDLRRVETLRDIGIDPFVMPLDKSNQYQKRFARWVNMKAIFKTCSWEDYEG